VIEGIVTALIVSFVYRARPEVLQCVIDERPTGELPLRSLLVAFVLSSLLIGGCFSWFASEHPDGLEWSIARITGTEELPETGLREHKILAAVQEKTSILPDYALPGGAGHGHSQRIGKSLSGIVGGTLTLVICALIGFALRSRGKP
jgi:cobalt/nickel transport system permease protein